VFTRVGCTGAGGGEAGGGAGGDVVELVPCEAASGDVGRAGVGVPDAPGAGSGLGRVEEVWGPYGSGLGCALAVVAVTATSAATIAARRSTDTHAAA
jgi:hypothetical protein